VGSFVAEKRKRPIGRGKPKNAIARGWPKEKNQIFRPPKGGEPRSRARDDEEGLGEDAQTRRDKSRRRISPTGLDHPGLGERMAAPTVRQL